MFNFSDRFQDLRSTIIGLVLLLASIIMGIVWIGIGLSRWLSACLGEVWGPIVLGLICFVPVVIFALVKAFGRSSARPSVNATQPGFGDPAAATIASLFEKVSSHSPFMGAAAAAVAAFLVHRFPTILPLFVQLVCAYVEDIKARACKAAADSDPTTPP